MNATSTTPCRCVDCPGADCPCGCNADAARSTAPVASTTCACGRAAAATRRSRAAGAGRTRRRSPARCAARRLAPPAATRARSSPGGRRGSSAIAGRRHARPPGRPPIAARNRADGRSPGDIGELDLSRIGRDPADDEAGLRARERIRRPERPARQVDEPGVARRLLAMGPDPRGRDVGLRLAHHPPAVPFGDRQEARSAQAAAALGLRREPDDPWRRREGCARARAARPGEDRRRDSVVDVAPEVDAGPLGRIGERSQPAGMLVEQHRARVGETRAIAGEDRGDDLGDIGLGRRAQAGARREPDQVERHRA